ncbi:hypothetical protein ACI43T_02355 [Neisseria oralis]|uniref:Uncharacterized protein n=1 Tax=Neisseria oralis TaxID=1107316 RepID=A0ABW8Q3B0_9NEIS
MNPVIPAQAGIQDVEFGKPFSRQVSVRAGLNSRLRGNGEKRNIKTGRLKKPADKN